MKVLIPTPLRPFAGGQAAIEVHADTAGGVLQVLTLEHPELRRHLYADDGKLRRFVNVYVNDEDIRYLDNESTPVRAGDTVAIIPSVAGGLETGYSRC